MHVELWPLSRLKPYDKNPRVRSKKAVAKVAASIKEFGFRQCIVADENDIILVGHTRRDAAESLGMTEVPVHQALGLTPAQKRAYRIADNRTNEETEWDEDLLKFELQGLNDFKFDLSLTGFDMRAVSSYLRSGPVDGEDDVPEPGPPVTQPGDLWCMDGHRLLCGDATKAEDVARVMRGEKAGLVLTDPPYGISIVNVKSGLHGKGTVGYGGLVGDDKPFDPAHLLTLGTEQVIFGANYFASRLPDGKAWLVWDKDASGNFSPVELAWTSREGRLHMYKHMWSGLRRAGPRSEEMVERCHPTQKPVGLFREILRDFSETGTNVIDAYMGSGTTLIAAEAESRRCYGLEIEPRYCDVIVARWEKFTGKTATLEGSGATFAHVAHGRQLGAQDAIAEEVLSG